MYNLLQGFDIYLVNVAFAEKLNFNKFSLFQLKSSLAAGAALEPGQSKTTITLRHAAVSILLNQGKTATLKRMEEVTKKRCPR